MMRRRGPGLVRGVARTAVVAGTASVVAGNVRHHQDEKWAQQSQEAYTQQQAELAAQAQMQAPAEPDMTTQLQQLAKLKDQGILTEEEFQAKKKQILGI